MVQSTVEPGAAWPLSLEYRLTEDDVRDFARSGRVQACGRLCRDQGLGLMPLILLGAVLLGLCYRSSGSRPVALMIGSGGAVLMALAALRWGRSCRNACRLAREIGVPLDLRLVASTGGITKEAGADESDPARTFAWSEVVGVDRVDHLTAIRLRPARAVLLIPDRAFPDDRTRHQFLVEARHRCAAGHESCR